MAVEDSLRIRFRSDATSLTGVEEEILRRIEQMVEDLGSHGKRCQRCNKVHATIERAIRYHMARYWVIDGLDREVELDFINNLRLALPPGVDIEVKMNEAKAILDE